MTRSGRAIALATTLAALLAWPAAPAVSSPGHAAEDSAHDVADEPRLARHTSAATAIDAADAAAAVTGAPHEVGQWGPVEEWPVVGIHNALLPNGKVLAFDSVGDKATEAFPVHDFTRALVWDPVTHTYQRVDVDTGYNIFCAGFAFLPNGSLFLAGGNKDATLAGIPQTHVFDPADNSWRLGPTMSVSRWYPTVTTMPNGEMLITEGGPDLPEVRTVAGGLRALNNASLNLPLYPWLDVAPNGRAFYSGPSTTMRSLSTAGGGSWQSHGERDTINRGYGSRAVYDVGKILVTGGGASSRDARVIDINGSTPTVTPTAQMAKGRRQHNVTVLADGSVLATGGNSSGASLVDLANGVYEAELWNPATGTWRTLAAQAVTRQYHSTAILLPDGRVLSSGGGICGTCDQVGYLAKNAEVFSPPYLFAKDGSGAPAPRPSISSAPSRTTYGSTLDVGTPDAASIRKVALVGLGSNTHSTEMQQRYVPLAFTAGGAGLQAVTPANANIAPPGTYMLFLINADGTPSVARMVEIGAAPAVALTAPADGASFQLGTAIGITATASDTDGAVAKVEFFAGATKLGEDATAPYALTWTPATAGTHVLTARATDDRGNTTTSSARSVTVTSAPAPNVPPTVSITSPANNAIVLFKSSVSIAASAGDSDGTVTRVEFFAGTTKLGEDTSAPYTYTWVRPRKGTHTLTARATDDRGATTTSGAVRITVF